MAYKLVTEKLEFAGLSTDDKPNNPPEGSTYHAVDTGEQYVFHDGMWVEDLRLTNALAAAL